MLPGADMESSLGHRRVLPGIVASWTAQAFTVVIGFLMPRLISDSIGAAELGVWDLCWTLLLFLGASGFGVGPALTHYWGRVGNSNAGFGLPGLLRTAAKLQAGLAILLGAIFVGLLMMAFQVLSESPGPAPILVIETVLLLALTGMALLIGDLGQAVLIANHRHHVGEYLSIASDVTLAIAMTVALLMGGELLALACVTLAVRLGYETQRVRIALRMIPTIPVSTDRGSEPTAAMLIRYVGKSAINGALDLLYPVAIRFALFLSAGPVALASYSRFVTLHRQILRIVERSLLVVPVMASVRAARGEREEIVALSVRASRLAILMMSPLLMIFALFGNDIVMVWMGPEFTVPGLGALLAAAIFLSIDRVVVNSVLSGMNAHGRIGLLSHGFALCLCVIAYSFMSPLEPLEAGGLIVIAALGLAIPQFVLASRRFEIGVVDRIRLIYVDPLLCNIPGAAFLLFAHALFHEGRPLSAAFMGAVGLASVPLIHWVWVLDENTRLRIRHLMLRSWS